MKLHSDKEALQNAIRAASDHFGRRVELVEKDYWVTYVLWKLAKSQYAERVVFKGGTSLSKVYNLIDRFSEDVDLAVLKDESQTDTQIRSLLRSVEKELSADFKEVYVKGVTSKQTKFRKTAHDYLKVIESGPDTGLKDKLIIEVNSFADPVPYKKSSVRSLIGQFLKESGNVESVEKYNLESFDINVLVPQSTLVEKILSLVRLSCFKNGIERIKAKIRHSYDIYFLAESKECQEFISSSDFINEFNRMYKEDKLKFNDPENWLKSEFTESPFFKSFDEIWKQVIPTYNTDFKLLVYGEFPDEKDVADKLKEIIEILKKE